MRAFEFLDEMALSSYKTLGNFQKTGPFTGADKRLVSHPKMPMKAQKFFQKTPFDFRLFFSNVPGTGKYSESGEVTEQELRDIFKDHADEILSGSEDTITVVYVGNKGTAKVMLTPWVMAHRFGHAIQAGNWNQRGNVWDAAEKHFFGTINRTLENYYNKPNRGRYPNSMNFDMFPEYNALFNAIGTQRSSRTNKINRPYEFLYEIFAQYLGTGRIKLNPLPVSLGYGRQAWGRHTTYMNIKPEFRDEAVRRNVTDQLEADMEQMFYDVLSNSVGKIYVM